MYIWNQFLLDLLFILFKLISFIIVRNTLNKSILKNIRISFTESQGKCGLFYRITSFCYKAQIGKVKEDYILSKLIIVNLI